MILAENCGGLALLYVPKADEQRQSALVIAEENVSEQLFEDSKSSRFELGTEELGKMGIKCQNVGADVAESELRALLQPDDLEDLL